MSLFVSCIQNHKEGCHWEALFKEGKELVFSANGLLIIGGREKGHNLKKEAQRECHPLIDCI